MNNKIKLSPLLDDQFLIRHDFRVPQSYDFKVEYQFTKTTDISEVARKTGVHHKDVVDWAVSNNLGLPQQPQKPRDKERKFRGVIGESLFSALLDSQNMNDIEPDHPGWDFEYKGCKVEVKSTAPKDILKGGAQLSQGEAPDVYVVFKFNNVGKVVSAYLLPVVLMKGRKNGVPKTLTIGPTQWSSHFEVELGDLEDFFKAFNHYKEIYFPNPRRDEYISWLKKPITIRLSKVMDPTNRLKVSSLFGNHHKWWENFLWIQAKFIYEFNHDAEWVWDVLPLRRTSYRR